jgi:nucleotide-binding universal stress UspA family protein
MAMRERQEERVFLVVIDESEEMRVALRYAARRAAATGGRVALFTSIEPTDFGHWQAVAELHEEESREAAEAMMNRYAQQVEGLCGRKPIIHIWHGPPRDSLLKLLEEDPRISVLVLAAGTSGKGPGPLISALMSKEYHRLTVPVTIVPGDLSDEELDAIT